MSHRRRILSIAVVLGLLAGIAFVVFPSSEDGIKTIEVYKAKEEIPAGEIIDEKKLSKEKVLKAEEWMLQNIADIKNLRTTETISTGRFIDKNEFTKDIPLVFGNGEGEYTVRVKAENVNGGRLEPGDEVKVIFVPRPEGGVNVATGIDSIRLEPKFLVLSIRTQYAKDVNEKKNDDLNNVPAAVTLKTTESEAAELAWYQDNGTLSLFVVRKGGELK